MFRKDCLEDRINGVHRKAIKKTREANYFHKISIPQKGIPKNVSVIVHRKGIEKQNRKFKIQRLFYKEHKMTIFVIFTKTYPKGRISVVRREILKKVGLK